MRVLVPTAIAALLLAGGALPAAAAPLPAGGGLHVTPLADAAPDRDSFTAKAEAQMREWQRKLDAAAESAKAKGEAGGDAASRALDHAWARTKEASHRLETASVDGWDSAKARFQKASHDLAVEWHKVYPGDK